MIIQIRGPMGSGKSTAVRHVLAAFAPAEELISEETGKTFAYRCQKNVLVLGRYNVMAGGCDRLVADRSADWVESLVRQYASQGYHVIFESLMLNAGYERWMAFSRDFPGQYVWTAIAAPPELALSRIFQRNGGKPIKAGIEDIAGKGRLVENLMAKAATAGERVIWLDPWRAGEELMEILADGI